MFFAWVTLIKLANAPLGLSAILVLSAINYVYRVRQLHWHPQNLVNPARNFTGAGLGRISDKWPGTRFTRAGAEIRYKPIGLLSTAAFLFFSL